MPFPIVPVIGAVSNLLGGLFGDKKKQTENFTRDSTTDTTAESTDLSPELLASLEGLFQNIVGGGGFSQATDAFGSRLAQLTERTADEQFDVEGFAKGVTDQAASFAGLDLESSINEILSASGASETGNSMTALLGNKMRNQTAANLAGISAQATATGEGIRQSQEQQLTEGIAGLGGSLSSSILELIQSTRGASNKGKGTSKEKTTGTGSATATEKKNPFSIIGDALGAFSKAKAGA